MKPSHWVMLVGCALLVGCARNQIHGYPRFWPKLVDESSEMTPGVPCLLTQTPPPAVTNALAENTGSIHTEHAL